MTVIAIGAPVRRSSAPTAVVRPQASADAAGVAGATATRLRLTVRGRRLLAFLAAIPAVIALSLAIVGGGAALASRDAGMPVNSFQTVTVLSGESLWSIAQNVAPGSDPRDVVDALMRLNALDTATVSAGQKLAIPAAYSASR